MRPRDEIERCSDTGEPDMRMARQGMIGEDFLLRRSQREEAESRAARGDAIHRRFRRRRIGCKVLRRRFSESDHEPGAQGTKPVGGTRQDWFRRSVERDGNAEARGQAAERHDEIRTRRTRDVRAYPPGQVNDRPAVGGHEAGTRIKRAKGRIGAAFDEMVEIESEESEALSLTQDTLRPRQEFAHVADRDRLLVHVGKGLEDHALSLRIAHRPPSL